MQFVVKNTRSIDCGFRDSTLTEGVSRELVCVGSFEHQVRPLREVFDPGLSLNFRGQFFSGSPLVPS